MNRSEALAGYTLVGQETDAGLSLHRDSTVALALRIRINDQSAGKLFRQRRERLSEPSIVPGGQNASMKTGRSSLGLRGRDRSNVPVGTSGEGREGKGTGQISGLPE